MLYGGCSALMRPDSAGRTRTPPGPEQLLVEWRHPLKQTFWEAENPVEA